MRLAWLIVAMLAVARVVGAADHYGLVTFGMLPVPGATVTATQGDGQVATVTDTQGVYRLSGLSDGVWTVRVEMQGFRTVSRDVAVAADAPPPTWELELVAFEEIARNASSGSPRAVASTPNPSNGSEAAAPSNAANSEPANPVNPLSAADGFLVNGSVNNGAASPFAQLAAFGNNRRGLRSLYNGAFGLIVGNSAFDARAFSFTGDRTPKPSYSDLQFAGTFGGPLRIPGLVANGPNVFAMYQRTSDHTATLQPALMPTLLERDGDFSQTRDAQGRAIQIVDPSTGLPFPGGVIPRERISPQAAALLGYYPQPNIVAPGRYNYQAPVLAATRQDSVQTRLTQPGFGRNQLFGSFAYQRTRTDGVSVFRFEDGTDVSGIDGAINWSRRFTQFVTLRLRYQFNRLATEVTPYFANRTNVSGDAQIGGNNQEPLNWGPPKLAFSSGIEALVDAQYSFNRSQTHAWNAETLWFHGRHNTTFGGDVRRQRLSVMSQQDARGTFTFTGSATGSDLADFLLGIPHASSIAFGNADKYLMAPSYAAYFTDDWRFGPGFTLNSGIRWEYEAPITERFGRLVNLDFAPGFTAASPVIAASPIGTTSGRRYPASLIHPDTGGVQPRLGMAWRPVAGSSLVIRAGYGIYRNTSVYQSIAMLMAQQPPLSTALSVESSTGNPLTLANGFTAAPGVTSNTFAIDPDFRVGYSENWQVSVQRDLPASLTVVTTYLGTKGRRLPQAYLPNTYPAGATNPCPQCPAGFVYLTSNGRSTRHAAQVQLRRRLRSGLTASVQYTLSKAMDDAAFSVGSGLQTSPSALNMNIAQDWLDPEAEWAPSNFDQRHQATAQFQYTTGVGVAGGALLTGVAGSIVKGWTLTGQLTAGSGLPLTPLALTSVAGTGVTGTIRGELTGATNEAPEGYFANPAAYTDPAPGRWGTAGRNSIIGPAQFGLNAGVTRTFLWGDRLNVDWRIDATNVLNRVTYSSVNTLVGSPQFGLPNRANTMRKIQTSLRLRF
jgi:hypothetical protein